MPAAAQVRSQSVNPLRRGFLVADVAGEDDVPHAHVRIGQVAFGNPDGDAVQGRVDPDRRPGHGIDVVGCGDAARQRDGDGSDARPGGEIEHPPAADGLGPVEDKACQRLSAGPAESPKRRRHAGFVQPAFGRFPDRGDLGRQPQPDLGNQRRRHHFGIVEDERARIGVGSGQPKTCPATMPINRISPKSRLDLNRTRQPFASSMSIVATCHPRWSAAIASAA